MALDPLNEPAHCALMVLYALSGRKAAAMHHYDELVRLLKDELDAPPSGETTALYDEIRSNRLGTVGVRHETVRDRKPPAVRRAV